MPNEPTTRPLRVAFYTRSARDTHDDVERTTRQADLAQAQIERTPEWILSEIITDTGSGLRIQPGLRRLLDHARNHQFDLLLVDRPSDLGRSLTLLAKILADLTRCGVTLRTLDGTLDTTTERLDTGIWLSPAAHQPTTTHRRISQRQPSATIVEEG